MDTALKMDVPDGKDKVKSCSVGSVAYQNMPKVEILTLAARLRCDEVFATGLTISAVPVCFAPNSDGKRDRQRG